MKSPEEIADEIYDNSDTAFNNPTSIREGIIKAITEERQEAERLLKELEAMTVAWKGEKELADKLHQEVDNMESLIHLHHDGEFKSAKQIIELKAKLSLAIDGLDGIEEYWNGGDGSAVDAAEEMKARATFLLTKLRSGE